MNQLYNDCTLCKKNYHTGVFDRVVRDIFSKYLTDSEISEKG